MLIKVDLDFFSGFLTSFGFSNGFFLFWEVQYIEWANLGDYYLFDGKMYEVLERPVLLKVYRDAFLCIFSESYRIKESIFLCRLRAISILKIIIEVNVKWVRIKSFFCFS